MCQPSKVSVALTYGNTDSCKGMRYASAERVKHRKMMKGRMTELPIEPRLLRKFGRVVSRLDHEQPLNCSYRRDPLCQAGGKIWIHIRISLLQAGETVGEQRST
jgi:hypothetical protein